MAAYAALCSLMHIIHQIQNHHRPPISLDKQQVESLTENLTFLQQFLEGYSSVGGYTKEADPLEARIADAAHAAEDVIESHIVDQIHAGAGSTSHGVKISSAEFYQGLQKVIQDMDSIKKQVMDFKERTEVRDQHHRNSISSADSKRPSTGQNMMVGFDEALLEILDKLTGGDHGRQVIPIVGMGGMGKTTLAQNVYVNPLIQQYFDICAWASISQDYDTREILREVFYQGNGEDMREVSEDELGEKLYKRLCGRRYLIVLDDMWNIDAWYKVRRFFPDYSNGSRIVITTRLSNLAFQLTDSHVFKMKFLDEDNSWNLFCKTVFGEEGCPLELEGIGKKIVDNCRGLPLSIVVTGGFLVKSKHTREYWEYIAENLNSLVNSEDNERCLRILYLSYKQLPVFLKPCFLYMGVLPEDSLIRATKLIRLWVAEGFLKPVSGKSLEEVAEECLEELTDRNLVCARRRFGKIKNCNIHDLLRDLCLREAQKERFYNVMKEHNFNGAEDIHSQRCIVIPKSTFEKEVVDDLQSMSLARSLIWEDGDIPCSLNIRLLRILNALERYIIYPGHSCLLENMFHLVNSRYFAIHVNPLSKFPSSICLFWNLQTLIVTPGRVSTAPSEIWSMPQLRYVKFFHGLYLPDPPRSDIDGQDDDIVLRNLQSLSTVADFKCSEEVLKRIPNVKKLGIRYYKADGSSDYCLNNLDNLQKLESFCCFSHPLPKPTGTDFLFKLSFPHSIKKLTLRSSHVHWDDIMEKIGSLPLLEMLRLKGGSFRGGVWETVEGQFSSLKLLMIASLHDLEHWNSENTHFPCLEQLVLKHLYALKEIPEGIGEIPTLQSIDLRICSDSAAISAKRIQEEQEELGDVTLQVRVLHRGRKKNDALESLSSPNFQVKYCL